MNIPTLLIAYYYPPRGGGGTQRTAKYVKYLRQFGVKPIVLTSGDAVQKNVDFSLAPLSSTPVVRVKGQEFSGKTQRLAEMILLPDSMRLWVAPAVRTGILAAKKFGVRLIYSTASPYTDHIVGGQIARALDVPWIADFRDLWTQNSLYQPRAPWQKYFHRRLEGQFYRDADQVIVASEWQRQSIVREFSVPGENISTITNGFDPEDFLSAQIPSTSSPSIKSHLTIGYLGSFYGKYRPDDLIDALEIIAVQHPDVAAKLKFIFVGDFDRQSSALLSRPSVSNMVSLQRYVPHGELQKIRARLDANLLYFPRLPGAGATIPQKLFEYLASRKPILAIIPEGDASKILENTGGALVTSSTNPTELAMTIVRFVERVRSGTLTGTTVNLDKFSRKNLAEQLSTIIKKTVR